VELVSAPERGSRSADVHPAASAIERAGIVAVVRVLDPARVRPAVEAILEGGIEALEITMSVPGAAGVIRDLAATLPASVVLGAGTVVDAVTAVEVIEAGARFVVSPVYRPAVLGACRERGAAVMPGCLTPTEILDAWDAGADIVKVFPATSLGPGFFKDLRGPLPNVKLMPTGGVTLDNPGEWLRAGAVAVGVGTALLEPAAVAAADWGRLRANAERIVGHVRRARQGQP
jgi:2-dehydro-3-deoxyphosphogluconate aldolase/(4S)-4-hydroxy-2-oxoglutarate aldolase